MDLRSPPSASASPGPGSQGKVTVILVLQFVMLAAFAAMAFFPPANSSPVETSNPNLRKIAGKLRAAGAIDEAAKLYSTVLNESSSPSDHRGEIAFGLAQLYLESGQYEKALRWLYEAQEAKPQELETEIAAKIVHCLERMGRVHAAKAALQAGTQISPQDSIQHADSDPVVAQIGGRPIHFSEVQEALDNLPPELSQQFSKPEAKPAFLKKYIADELLWRKAQKLEYDRDPTTQRYLAALSKQVVVGKFIEKEVAEKIAIEATDVKNFFEANKDRFKKGDQEPTFQTSKEQATQAYRMMKFQRAYQQLIESELSTGDVQIFSERIPK